MEAVLETAHIRSGRAYQPKIIRYPDLFLPGNLSKTAAALGIPQGASTSYYAEPTLVATWNGHDPLKRFLAKEYRDQRISWDAIDSWVRQGQFTWDDFSKLVKVTELLPDVELEDVAVIFEEYEADEGQIFIGARRLAALLRGSPCVGQLGAAT